jgi:hypothetical protein
MKFMTQKALERRPANDTRPVFIWADEAHYFSRAYRAYQNGDREN